jgi:hypothetical protein
LRRFRNCNTQNTLLGWSNEEKLDRWDTRNVKRGEERRGEERRDVYKILIGKIERKSVLGRHNSRWEGIKTDLKEIGWRWEVRELD